MRRNGHGTRLIVAVLAVTAFSAGLALPWAATDRAVDAQAPPADDPPALMERRPAPAPPIASRAASGVLAVGDDRLHAARECLEQRGITVHPRVVRSALELHEVLAGSASTYAAVVIHLEGDVQLVDGHIERVLTSLRTGTRVVWSTIILDDLPWGAFSYEDRVNASVRNVIAPDPEGRVLDWQHAARRHPQWNSFRGFTIEGCREYAKRAATLSGALGRG